MQLSGENLFFFPFLAVENFVMIFGFLDFYSVLKY
jgi:hypothetical protein